MYLLELAVLLLWAKIGGFLSNRLKQPSVLGQILAGVILGPMVLGLLKETETIKVFADLGVIFLMFIAGLETDIYELKESSSSSAVIAGLGVLVPFGMGTGAAYLLGINIIESLFIGVILTATSVSISVQTLREMGKLQSRQGVAILGAAIIDDILGIIMLTLLISFVSHGPSQNGVLMVIGKMLLFFVLAGVLGYAATKVLTRFSNRFNVGDRVVTLAVVMCFLAAFYAENMGVAAITGAYFAGIIFSTTPFRNKVSYNIQKMAYTLFTPVFFISIGLKVESGNMGSAIGVGLTIAAVAIISKVLGCGIGAKVSGFNTIQSMQVGVGMIPRGEVALIIADIGLRMNVAGSRMFASVIMVVLITTLVTPPLLKYVFDREAKRALSSGK
ncbi:MAG: Na+/H+ antiporter [Firmicutes bacterium]|nr:Na+/H+ antiporter [Bacillota bacterium]MDI6706071.1 cation:proton antiporter [Bacillota bacterium]